ncbi:hypothetical protein HanRHA438_Chr11g0495381 [Helianthus annuus]|nr:hypothetical protein HanRHA438_Chr11g0495381 [Helianthus annuus]
MIRSWKKFFDQKERSTLVCLKARCLFYIKTKQPPPPFLDDSAWICPRVNPLKPWLSRPLYRKNFV